MAETSSSNEVTLRFRLRQLADAEAAVKRVAVEVQKADNLSKETKQRVAATTREQIVAIRAERAALESLRRTAAQNAGGSIGPLDAITSPAQAANRARERLTAGANVLRGQFGGVAGLAGALGGPAIAAIAALVYPLLKAVMDKTQEDFRNRIKDSAELLRVQIAEAAYQADYGRRLRESPEFRQAEADRAFRVTAGRDAARLAAGNEGADDFVEDF